MKKPFASKIEGRVIALLVVVIASAAVLIVINYFTIKTTSAVRAYINGESSYSKGQKDAVHDLIMYINTQQDNYWSNFTNEMRIPLGDSTARVNLLNHGDVQVIRNGFLAGKNHPADLSDMIWLFRNFHNVSFMSRAIQIWKEGDHLIAQLNKIGNDADSRIRANSLSASGRDSMLISVNTITYSLTKKEEEFSDTLGAAARAINNYLFITNILMTFLIIGGASGYAIVMINRLKNSERLLKKQNESLTETNHQLDKFVYSASHDLRSPLTSLKGLIEIALLENNIGVIKDYLGMMSESISKQDQFIKDIIAFSKNKRTGLVNEDVPLNKIIDESIEQYRFMQGGDKIVFEKEIQLEIIHTDASRLKTVLGNIISNAIKYSDDKKANPFIHFKTLSTNGNAVIEIEDNGIGIKKEYISRIFDMFFVANNTRNGTGLGLYITKESVEKMNGTLQVESNEGVGTKFTLTLPINE